MKCQSFPPPPHLLLHRPGHHLLIALTQFRNGRVGLWWPAHHQEKGTGSAAKTPWPNTAACLAFLQNAMRIIIHTGLPLGMEGWLSQRSGFSEAVPSPPLSNHWRLRHQSQLIPEGSLWATDHEAKSCAGPVVSTKDPAVTAQVLGGLPRLELGKLGSPLSWQLNTILNKTGHSRQLWLVPDFRGKAFRFVSPCVCC